MTLAEAYAGQNLLATAARGGPTDDGNDDPLFALTRCSKDWNAAAFKDRWAM